MAGVSDPVSALWESPRRLVWKSDIAKCIFNDNYALITGPPGIGKTFLMEQEFLAKAQVGAAQVDKLGRTVLRLDGSNERFTLESMSDWLDRNIVGTDPVMLIVDEFHRLPRDMKDQLLRWCSTRRFIKLVMIANRWVWCLVVAVDVARLLDRALLPSMQACMRVECRVLACVCSGTISRTRHCFRSICTALGLSRKPAWMTLWSTSLSAAVAQTT